MYNNEQTYTPVPTLLGAYDQDNERFRLRVGRDRARSSYLKLLQGRCYVAEFLTQRLGRPDIELTALTVQFIHDFAAWLSTERRLRNGSVWLACQLLKGVARRAHQRGWMAVNPFDSFHIAKNVRPREYLTEEEIGRVMKCPVATPQLALARDVFVFACFTGLSFIDLQQLTADDLTEVGGEPWIVSRRRKTRVPYQVKLLPVARSIIRRYNRNVGHIFGELSYRTLALQVHQLMAVCGISKRITLHCARHSFAVMALNNGMPIESISRMLGHTNITTTQLYAKITMKKLGSDIATLERMLAGRFG